MIMLSDGDLNQPVYLFYKIATDYSGKFSLSEHILFTEEHNILQTQLFTRFTIFNYVSQLVSEFYNIDVITDICNTNISITGLGDDKGSVFDLLLYLLARVDKIRVNNTEMQSIIKYLSREVPAMYKTKQGVIGVIRTDEVADIPLIVVNIVSH